MKEENLYCDVIREYYNSNEHPWIRVEGPKNTYSKFFDKKEDDVEVFLEAIKDDIKDVRFHNNDTNFPRIEVSLKMEVA